MNQPGMTAVPVQGGILPILPNPVQGLQQMMQKLAVKLPQGHPPLQAQAAAAAPNQTTCPNCGINPAQTEQAGRFGCPGCYEAFKTDIETMVMRHHGAIQHVGKVPKAWKARRDAGLKEPHETTVDRAVATVKRHKLVPFDERIKLLEDRMKACVKTEDYERAALIRDVLKQMKTSAPSASEQMPEPASGTPLAA